MQNQTFKTGGKAAWAVLIVLTLLNILNYMDRMVISVAMEAIRLDLGFNDTQMGLIQGLFFLGVGLLILPAGIMIDKWARNKAVSLMAVIWSVSTVATGLCSNFVSILAARFGTAAGEAGFQPGGTAWLSIVFDQKDRGKVNSIFLIGASVGSLLGMVTAGILISRTGNWRIPFYVFGIPGVILGLIALLLKDAKTAPRKENAKELLNGIGGLFRKKSFVTNSISQGAWIMVLQTILAWNVVLIMRAYNINEEQAGMVLGPIMLLSAVSTIIGGILADKLQDKITFGRPFVAAIGCLLGSVAVLIQLLTAGSVSYEIYTVIMAISFFLVTIPIASFQVINMDIFPFYKRGTAASVSGLFVFLFFSWWGTILVGVISDQIGGGLYGIKTALIFLVPFGLVAAMFSFLTCKYYPADALELEESELSPIEQCGVKH